MLCHFAAATFALFLDPYPRKPLAPYYRDPRIHNLGDTALHSSIARFATNVIDNTAYSGEDVRSVALSCIPKNMTVVDLCCGTGTSTRIPGVGVDVSENMIREARWRRGRWSRFEVGNAEIYGEDNSYDVATLFFCLHEMPRGARMRVLSNACRISRFSVYIMDISTKSLFSKYMIRGEPYLLEYQANILEDLSKFGATIHSVVNDRILYSEIRCDSENPKHTS